MFSAKLFSIKIFQQKNKKYPFNIIIIEFNINLYILMIKQKKHIKRSVSCKINKTPKILLITLYLLESKIENRVNLLI
jgi:hypothetical protein